VISIGPYLFRRLAALAEMLDEPKTAREVSTALGIPPTTAYERLGQLEALGRAQRVDAVRYGQHGPKATRWRRLR
jgi:DNA-binding IclR family transcriptional regulator